MLFIAHQNQNISQSFRKSCHSHRTPSRDKYKRSGSRKIYRRRGETESVKTRRSISARVFIESFLPLPLPPSSWKMHEATTINSFRHFLDNRETFNRGEGARRRKGVGIEALCAHRIPLWSLAALYHRRHLEKRFPFERANTFSVEGGEVAFLERTQRFPWKSLSIVARSPRFLPSRRASKECGLIERWTTSMNFIPKEERGWRLRRSILNLSRNEVGANYPTCLSRISAHSNFFWTKLLLLLTTVYNGYVKRIAATIHPALLTWRTEGRADRSNATPRIKVRRQMWPFETLRLLQHLLKKYVGARINRKNSKWNGNPPTNHSSTTKPRNPRK